MCLLMGRICASLSKISNEYKFNMIKSFSFLLDFGPDGFHFFEWSFALSVKNKNNRVNSFKKYGIKNVWGLIGCSVPKMNIALIMKLLWSFFIGFDIFDFFNDSVGLLTWDFMNWRRIMFIGVNQWAFSWF